MAMDENDFSIFHGAVPIFIVADLLKKMRYEMPSIK